MPTYNFLNTETNEEIEVFMSMKAKDQFMIDNPHLQTIIQAPAIVSGVAVKGKVPDGFKEVLSKIAEKTRGSELADRYGRNDIKQAKTAEVVRKHTEKLVKRGDV